MITLALSEAEMKLTGLKVGEVALSLSLFEVACVALWKVAKKAGYLGQGGSRG